MALTIKDIAKECGCAVSTVSRALNDKPDVSSKTKTRIQQVALKHGFVPNVNAQKLKQQHTDTVCLIVKGHANLLFGSIVEQMQQEVELQRHASAVYYLDEDDNEVALAAQLCRELKPLGFAFLGGRQQHFAEGYAQVDLPGVLVTNQAEELGIPKLSSVTVDEVAGASMAIHYLLDCGHRHIGVLGGNRQLSDTARMRYEGCVQSLEKAGVAFDEKRQYSQCRFSMPHAYEAMRALRERCPEMTAVFAMGDVMAIGAIRALGDMGLSVPGDLSVMGYDGTMLADYYSPRLTTMRQPGGMLAKRAAEILLERIERGFEAVHETVPCTLHPGESVRSIEGETQA